MSKLLTPDDLRRLRTRGVRLTQRATPKPPPPWLAARQEACNRCDLTDCMLKNLNACARNARLKRPNMACPVGTWGPEVEGE